MFASSTPVFSRKRKSSGAISSPGVSPIRRPMVLPKLPKGITVQISRVPLRNKTINQESRTASSAYEEKVPLGYISGIKPLVAVQPFRRQQKEDIPVAAKSSRVGSAASNVVYAPSKRAKKNESNFPELIEISDSDEERRVNETNRLKTRLSVAAKRRRITSAVNEASNIPSINKEPHYLGDSALHMLQPSQLLGFRKGVNEKKPAVAGKRCTSIRLDLDPDTLSILETEGSKAPNPTRSRGPGKRAARNEVAQKNKAIDENEEEETIEFAPATGISLQTEISKFTLAGVESWKEVKDQPGAFFSKGLQAYTSGADGDAFPAKAGYLKMSVKTRMEIPSCGTNVIFTVIKGKGYLKNKTNGTDEKTEMNVGDIFIAPRGSNFSFINQATKNEFFLSYVKIV